jgi:hypothetical protein
MELVLGIELDIIAVFLDSMSGFFIINVAYALEEHEREYVLLVRAGVDIGAQQDGGLPEVGFQFIQSDSISHRCNPLP